MVLIKRKGFHMASSSANEVITQYIRVNRPCSHRVLHCLLFLLTVCRETGSQEASEVEQETEWGGASPQRQINASTMF